MLQPVQLGQGADPAPARPAGSADTSFELLLAFTRALIANTCGQDVLILAMYQAADATGRPQEEVARMLQAVLAEQKVHGTWPEGF